MQQRRVVLTLLCLSAVASAQSDPRRTATVALVERCGDAVVSIRVRRAPPGVDAPLGVGSGSVVHEGGWILTNDHVVNGSFGGDVHLRDGRSLPFRIVASFPHEDLALLRVDADLPLTTLPLGRSDDLMLGEPALAIGDPAALPFTVSEGIVSGLSRSTATERAFLPSMVQTTAAISGGSSGGPLINALGQQIGVVTSKKDGAQNVAFAITVDRVRQVLPEMLAVEERGGFRLGLTVDPLAKPARVVAVAEGSPAAAAGILPGDVVTQVGDRAVDDGTDALFALVGRAAGETLVFRVRRAAEALVLEAELVPLGLEDPVAVDGLVPGLDFALYHGAWDTLPDFTTLEPAATGTVERPAADVHGDRPDDYALVFTGYVDVPHDGLWQFATGSDDGSKLSVGERVVVDNDGLHGFREAVGFLRLRAGLYPIRVAFFERGGAERLTVSFASERERWAQIPPTAFRRRPE